MSTTPDASAPDGALTLEQIINFLLETPLFESLDPTELAEVVGIMQLQRLRSGQVLFGEGDEGDAWYVIFRGACEVTKQGPLGRRSIATLGPHTCFGEMAVLDGSARSAGLRFESTHSGPSWISGPTRYGIVRRCSWFSACEGLRPFAATPIVTRES